MLKENTLHVQKESLKFDFECNCLKSVKPDSVGETMSLHYLYLLVNFVTFTFLVCFFERMETVKGRKHISEYQEEKRLKRLRASEKKNEKIRLYAERRRLARMNRSNTDPMFFGVTHFQCATQLSKSVSIIFQFEFFVMARLARQSEPDC